MYVVYMNIIGSGIAAVFDAADGWCIRGITNMLGKPEPSECVWIVPGTVDPRD